MDWTRYSTIAHRDHRFCSPFSKETVDGWISRLPLGPDPRVLDVGCGKGQMIISVLERWGGTGVGVDFNESHIAEARLRGSHLADALEFRAERYSASAFADGSFDLALCIGSTHAVGTYVEALQELTRIVGPGGVVAVGSGYWKQPPDIEYLAVLESTPDELMSHQETVEAGIALGLVPLFAVTSTEEEWDAYEGLYAASVEAFAVEQPDDPERDEMLEQIRSWQEAYRKWGRETLGFGVYVFGK